MWRVAPVVLPNRWENLCYSKTVLVIELNRKICILESMIHIITQRLIANTRIRVTTWTI